LRTQEWRVGVRPVCYWSSWIALFVVFSTPSVYPQQTKQPVAPPTPLTPESQVVSEANERIAQLARASEVKQGDYVIGAGDLLAVEVFDVPELSREVRVSETGYISLPLVPSKIHAEGLTPYQLQDKLAEILQSNGLVSTPQVTVSMKEQHGQPITMIGEVRSPMVIQATRQLTLLQALSQAGGISEAAGNNVIITRQEHPDPAPADSGKASAATAPQTFTISLSDVLESGDPRFNIPLVGGDVVSIPRAGIIYVVGAINHPGGFVLHDDRDRMTALKMLSLAGGTTPTAKTKNAVILRKNLDSGKRDEVPIDLSKLMKLQSTDVQLVPNDILFVPDSSGKKALHRAGDVAVGLTTGLALIAAGRI
jgi:polysaccharide biosynthesis/export protein